MSVPAIRLENLGKRYRLGKRERYKALRDVLAEAAVRPFKALAAMGHPGGRADAAAAQTIWALRDVSFEVDPGEVVGIVGRNGAGKSTLLKILSRITEPTTGAAEVRGRVGALLEVGTGFHPELTGRENIFLNGAILGMGRKEIEAKFDEIVAFAEVDPFIDTAVKHYSSGMYLRLAFAVAAHLEPEILFIDEVLAVGDASFQKKCLSRMGDVAHEGRTILFVSHNMTAIQSLCGRAIWLDEGRVVASGDARAVVAEYLEKATQPVLDQVWSDPARAPGTDQVRLRRARVSVADGGAGGIITVRTPLEVEFEYWNFLPDTQLNLSMHVFSLEGVCVFNTVSPARRHGRGLVRGVCSIPGDFLNDGTYRASIMIVKDQSVVLYKHDDVVAFEVHDVERDSPWYGRWSGVVRPRFEWMTETVDEAPRGPS